MRLRTLNMGVCNASCVLHVALLAPACVIGIDWLYHFSKIPPRCGLGRPAQAACAGLVRDLYGNWVVGRVSVI
jgi:hypothetical protein